MLMRWTRKIVIIGLAAFGVHRLIELARPRLDHARDRVTPHLHDAAARARGAADDVVSDVTDAREVLRDATEDVSADLVDAVHEIKAEAEHAVHDIKTLAEQQGSSFGDDLQASAQNQTTLP